VDVSKTGIVHYGAIDSIAFGVVMVLGIVTVLDMHLLHQKNPKYVIPYRIN
jgi:hypothetical protein